ncbi:alanine dehydrogenase [Limibacter armeniacum]|uniref:alanine dehydrogenase n=1 Tax=Limibacter armeniacum TaxID=466084 RepID=UPI002FE67092
MGKEKEGFKRATEEFYQYHPQEMMLKTPQRHKNPITIGMPKETCRDEKRIMLRPEAVNILVNNGYEILLESGAGVDANLPDQEYSDAGAKIVYTAKEAWGTDIILRVSPPSIEELSHIKKSKTVITALNINNLTKEYLQEIVSKKLVCLAFELLEDKVGGLPVVRAMSEIAGSTVMLIAAEYLSSFNNGRGIILGGITGVPPSKIVILGAGTVAEYAARTAIGMGADVKVFDNHIYRLRRLKDVLGTHQLYTSVFDNGQLREALSTADVVIGAVHSNTGRPLSIVTEEMIAEMKANSIIIDVSIDQGGCFETSYPTTLHNPVYKKHGVIHYCVPNIASRVSRTASTAVSNIFTPILTKLIEEGGTDQMMRMHPWFTKGVYAYKGGITNKFIAEKYDLPCRNLELILAASI